MLHIMTLEERQGRDERIEALLAEMAAGERHAMGELYELIRADIYAFALSKLGHRVDAEDITQDTFVRIWQYAPSYKPMGKPMAWILTMEHNLIRGAVNRAGRTVTMEDYDDRDSTDVEDEVIKSEFLRELMRTLSPDEREIITLHVLSGLRHREIAAMLGLPLSTVLSRYNRAIKKLQRLG